MTDTDRAELAPDSSRPTLPPRTPEQQMDELVTSLAESNALSILAREASERCANKVTELLETMRRAKLRADEHERRLDRIERHLGLDIE